MRKNIAEAKRTMQAVKLIAKFWRLYKSKQRYVGTWINPRNEVKVIKI